MPDNEETFKLVEGVGLEGVGLEGVGLEVFDTVSSIMQAARTLLRNLAIVQMLC